MTRCKKSDEHVFKLDTPTFFHKDKQTPEEYYTPAIEKILNGTDDWFYQREHVFVHLECIHCQKEEHSYFKARYLKSILNDNTVRFGFETIKRLQYTLPDGEVITHDIKLNKS